MFLYFAFLTSLYSNPLLPLFFRVCLSSKGPGLHGVRPGQRSTCFDLIVDPCFFMVVYVLEVVVLFFRFPIRQFELLEPKVKLQLFDSCVVSLSLCKWMANTAS